MDPSATFLFLQDWNCMYICIFGFKGMSTSKIIGTRNERIMDDYDGQMMFGDLVGLKFPDFRLSGEEKPRKTSPRKLVPTGDRTRARSVTSAYATTCSTAVGVTYCCLFSVSVIIVNIVSEFNNIIIEEFYKRNGAVFN